MEKKLKRSLSNKMLGGVCAGFAEYFDTDVTLVRILWILFTLFGGAGIIIYIACLIIMPTENKQLD